ncbi:tyrosine decarboxylase 1-like [Panicum miliaceum]|uniref:Tyrosine decarboxylase 1-like n=1 Tax=Panicum miliaceum TaxID=4540 RepID=A0A3L6PIQ2_PANMI|nr:tyrosine decarboxylase 1-like [Panicum miliaceum]
MCAAIAAMREAGHIDGTKDFVEDLSPNARIGYAVDNVKEEGDSEEEDGNGDANRGDRDKSNSEKQENITSEGPILCAKLDTSKTAVVDPVRELCTVVATHGVCWHVGTAYARFRHLADGADTVDSFSMNAHKWLIAAWVRRLVLLVAGLGTEHEYILKNATLEGHVIVDYNDWSVMLTRRFRALKVWLMLRYYSIEDALEN